MLCVKEKDVNQIIFFPLDSKSNQAQKFQKEITKVPTAPWSHRINISFELLRCFCMFIIKNKYTK